MAHAGTAFLRADPGGFPSRRSVAAAAGLAYALLLVRTAWVSDDAYITFRTVMNVLNGLGPRWNIANRVQAFTHPLWMLVMAAAAFITHEVYFTSIVVSIALSVAVVVLVATRLASSLPLAILALSTFAVSKSFVEYSTSGLENALTHLLLVGFFITTASGRFAGRQRIFALSLLTSLLMLNRLDTGLLVLPALGIELWKSRAVRPWVLAAAGMLPLAAWELFSLIYYGFPFPNTAYAKLGGGVPRAELVYQGALYLLDSVGNDPITLLAILAAILSPWLLACSGSAPAGIALYVAYVVWVGGDFMSGRFLAAPLLCAVAHLCRQPIALPFGVRWATALGVIWIVGLSGPRPMMLSNDTFGDIAPNEAIPASHVTDERRYYYASSGLLKARRGTVMPDHRWLHLGEDDLRQGVRLALTDAAGFVGYGAGPTVHLIDRWALGDPLLARLPAEVPWQIGHFTRRIPAGYERSILEHANHIEDTNVAAYYEALRIITEDPIWSRRRFRTIWRMNLGGYEPYIASYGVVRRTLDEVAIPVQDGVAWDIPGALVMTLRGASIKARELHHGETVELSVSGNDDYRVVFRLDEKDVAEQVIRQPLEVTGGLRAHRIRLAPAVAWNEIAVLPSGGDSHYSLGYLRLLP